MSAGSQGGGGLDRGSPPTRKNYNAPMNFANAIFADWRRNIWGRYITQGS